ncbi:MAG: ferritin-like domain-containing protein, partial [Burkholderiaceae bacterium]
MQAAINIEALGLHQGAHLLVKRALEQMAVGETLQVDGSAPDWDTHLLVWCRQNGHAVSFADDHAYITRGPFQQGRWHAAVQSGSADRTQP